MSEDFDAFKGVLGRVADGHRLSEQEAESAFDTIMTGNATPAQIGAFLMALRLRGETVDEITGAARTMRAKAARIAAPDDAIDVVGTGGDGAGTLNISTAAALVVAGCGIPVAKHGNRALSSRAGAADVLTALGVDIDAPFPSIEKSIREARIGFMMAPRHHSATRHVSGPRVELAVRTVFNLLGPLSNPAFVRRLLVGVFAPEWLEPLAEVLGRLGSERAWVVHGAGGLDELTSSGETRVAEWSDGAVRSFTVTAADAGLAEGSLEDLKGGTGTYNAERLGALLDGAPGTYRDSAIMTAAGSLVVAGAAGNLAEGASLAARSIDRGDARAALARMVAISNEDAAPEGGRKSETEDA